MANDIASLLSKLNAPSYSPSNTPKVIDNRLFKPRADKDNGGYTAIIRFIPAKDDTDPIVKVGRHNIQKGKAFYNELCPESAHPGTCPVCNHRTALYKKGDKVAAKGFWPDEEFYVNILIIKDTTNPDNNGKTFIWKCPKKVFKKITDRCVPPAGSMDDNGEALTGVNIFDLELGCNFKLNGAGASFVDKAGNAHPYVNFDESSFTAPVALKAELVAVAKSDAYDLREFNAPELFKTTEALQKRFDQVNNGGVASNGALAASLAGSGSTVEVPTNTTSSPPVDPNDVEGEEDAAFLERLRGKNK